MTDRPPNKQGLSHGGVLIAVTNEFLSNEAKELKTNYEMQENVKYVRIIDHIQMMIFLVNL